MLLVHPLCLQSPPSTTTIPNYVFMIPLLRILNILLHLTVFQKKYVWALGGFSDIILKRPYAVYLGPTLLLKTK